jgi:hypothetical protein
MKPRTRIRTPECSSANSERLVLKEWKHQLNTCKSNAEKPIKAIQKAVQKGSISMQ